MQPFPRDEQAMMRGGHRAVAHLLRVMPTLDDETHWAVIALLLTVLEAWNQPPDAPFHQHGYECLLAILTTIPGLVEQVPVQ